MEKSFDTVGPYTIHRSEDGVEIIARPDLGGMPARIVIPVGEAGLLADAIMRYAQE